MLFTVGARTEKNSERKSSSKNMCHLPETFYLAQEVGKMLG